MSENNNSQNDNSQPQNNEKYSELKNELNRTKDEMKFLANAFNKMTKSLKKMEHEKEEFVSMISHELKTPLVPIKGYVDLLLSEQLGTLNEKQKSKLEIISSSADTLRRLISDLLDVEKIELRALKLVFEENDISKVINDTVTKLKPEFDKHNISLGLNISPNLMCDCDSKRIDQVLTNLINNSIDFIPKSEGKITISASSDEEFIKITVADNGAGIPEEKLDKIFVKFYQIDSTLTREYGGTGLGLSVCKGIVESHGGKIWAESKLGHGTEFKFTLLKKHDSKEIELKALENSKLT